MGYNGALRCHVHWRSCCWLLSSIFCIAYVIHAHATTAITCTRTDRSSSLFSTLRDNSHDHNFIVSASLEAPIQLIIGIKTSVLHGIAVRRALRSTWANPSALPSGVRAVFLGCSPDLTHLSESEATRVRNSIAAEQQQYNGDLLVDELASCRDAYDDLVNKVLAFFQWSAHHAHQTTSKAFVMVTDDDIYLRVDKILDKLSDPAIPTHRFYGGQVWATVYGRAIEPRRMPQDRYFIPRDHYPLNQLPPFANGPHYLLSADVAHFIGQHRGFFRGVGGDPTNPDNIGTLDDVSVALWMLAMQIHPHHFDQFVNLRDRICSNMFIAFADLTPTAIVRIHENVKHNRSVCDGFSYVTWLKRFVPVRTQRDLDDDVRRLKMWQKLRISTRVTRFSPIDNIQVYLEMTMIDNPLRNATADFKPAKFSFYLFCTMLADHITKEFDILAHQLVFVCQQLRTTVLSQLTMLLEQHPRQRPLVQLLLHNLANIVVAPKLNVMVTKDAHLALIVIENLVTQAYPGTEIQIHDEISYPQDEGDPDVLFFSATETALSYANRYKTSRLVLFHPRTLVVDDVLSHRILTVSSTRVASSKRHLYLSLASTAFGNTNEYLPLDLLQAFGVRTRLTNVSVPTFRLQHFCIDDYAPHQCVHPHREYFFNLLNALDHVDVSGSCLRDAVRRGFRNRTTNESLDSDQIFGLDVKVARYTPFKFTIAFEDAVNVPGVISETIVAAFLAGSVPIYYGHSATITNLFNPQAFIDCGAFASLRVCATHVLAVHASPSLYASMRRAPPIVNRTAFEDVFSWHPDVVETMKKDDNVIALTDRFRMLLNSVS